MTASPLSPSLSRIALANAALAKLGVRPIGSFLDTSHQARTVNALFDDVMEECFSFMPWRFARARIAAQKSADPAPAPWEALYVIPTDFVVIRSVWDNGFSTQFDRFETAVAVNPLSSTSTIEVEGTRAVEPAEWTGMFRSGFINYLAGELAMPVTKDESLRDYYTAKGREGLLLAASRDGQGRTPSRIDTKTFIRQRRGGRG